MMNPPNIVPNILHLQYPNYVQTKRVGPRSLYIPGEGLKIENNAIVGLEDYFKELKRVNDVVFDGIIVRTGMNYKFHIFDCVFLQDWKEKNTKNTYSERLHVLREYIYGVLAKVEKYMDETTIEVFEPAELVEFYKKCLQDGHEGVIIRDINGRYVFGNVADTGNEMLFLKPTAKDDNEKSI